MVHEVGLEPMYLRHISVEALRGLVFRAAFRAAFFDFILKIGIYFLVCICCGGVKHVAVNILKNLIRRPTATGECGLIYDVQRCHYCSVCVA